MTARGKDTMIDLFGMKFRWTFVLGALLWLPAVFLIFGLLRGFGVPPAMMMVRDMLTFAVLGVPLALTCRAIHAMGRARLAWALFGPLAFVTFGSVLMGGLFGPVGLLLAALLGCLPALAVWGGLFLWQRRRGGHAPMEGDDTRDHSDP